MRHAPLFAIVLIGTLAISTAASADDTDDDVDSDTDSDSDSDSDDLDLDVDIDLDGIDAMTKDLESLGDQIEKQFGPDFQRKMEKLGKDIERRVQQQFGEQFQRRIQAQVQGKLGKLGKLGLPPMPPRPPAPPIPPRMHHAPPAPPAPPLPPRVHLPSSQGIPGVRWERHGDHQDLVIDLPGGFHVDID